MLHFKSGHHFQNPPGATTYFPNSLRKLERMGEEISTYGIESAQATEQCPRYATKKVCVQMGDSSSIVKSITSRKTMRKRRSNSLCMPNNSDRLVAESVRDPVPETTAPAEQGTGKFPEGKASVAVINKCPGCSETAIRHFTTLLDHRHHLNGKSVAFKAVYRCTHAQCKKEFALNPMWDVPVRPDDFPLQLAAQSLEPDHTKELLHSCPKCYSTSTEFNYFKIFRTEETAVACEECLLRLHLS